MYLLRSLLPQGGGSSDYYKNWVMLYEPVCGKIHSGNLPKEIAQKQRENKPRRQRFRLPASMRH